MQDNVTIATSFENFFDARANGRIEALLRDLEPVLPYQSQNDGGELRKPPHLQVEVDVGLAEVPVEERRSHRYPYLDEERR